jgi:hypothetical protein
MKNSIKCVYITFITYENNNKENYSKTSYFESTFLII